MFVYGFLFLRGECKFCVLAVFLLGLAAELQKEERLQQLIDQYVNNLMIRFQQKEDLYISSQMQIFRCDVVLNWLQEQSSCLRALTHFFIDPHVYSFSLFGVCNFPLVLFNLTPHFV